MKTIPDIPPFFVGQEVVAIRDHSRKVFKKGDEFKVTSVKRKCCGWNITVGIRSVSGYDLCMKCGLRSIAEKEEWGFDSISFAPKHNYGEFISLKQVVEEALVVQGAN